MRLSAPTGGNMRIGGTNSLRGSANAAVTTETSEASLSVCAAASEGNQACNASANTNVFITIRTSDMSRSSLAKARVSKKTRRPLVGNKFLELRQITNCLE